MVFKDSTTSRRDSRVSRLASLPLCAAGCWYDPEVVSPDFRGTSMTPRAASYLCTTPRQFGETACCHFRATSTNSGPCQVCNAKHLRLMTGPGPSSGDITKTGHKRVLFQGLVCGPINNVEAQRTRTGFTDFFILTARDHSLRAAGLVKELKSQSRTKNVVLLRARATLAGRSRFVELPTWKTPQANLGRRSWKPT